MNARGGRSNPTEGLILLLPSPLARIDTNRQIVAADTNDLDNDPRPYTQAPSHNRAL